MKTFETDKKPLIMIVDDNPKNIQLVGSILRKNIECDFSFAGNGVQALELVAKTPPDLILLDVMMPIMDGYETCRKLKAEEKTRDIPVIFLTAKVDSEDVVEGFELGAVDYVPKPFKPSELLARVKTQLKLKEKSDIVLRQNDERKQLLHVLCHDLSNPFSSLISCMDLVSEPDMFVSLKPELLNLAQNGLNIIELVRKMRYLDEKGLQLDPEPTPLCHLIDHSASVMQQKLKHKNIDLVVNVDQDINVHVESVSFVNSVINNLLSNAIKFSHEGDSIEVTAAQEAEQITIKVCDHGIGMPENICHDLFDIRKATSRPGTNGEPGTGFGMPLVKKFVESYNGQIIVTSKDIKTHPDAHGTEVTITLPAPA